MDGQQLHADYLVVGAGIAGLGFVDVLLKEDQSCTVVIADLFEKPGGKYNRWPSFCNMDGPINTWGVESKKFEGSTADDVLKYCQEVMRSFIKSGRVRFIPRHKANETGTRLTHVLNPDRGYDVFVARKVVDATCTMPRTQVGPKRDIEVDGSAQLVPPYSLPTITSTHAQYVVIGSGYIGIRTVLWLLSAGVSPHMILWVVPRSRRFLAREMFQAEKVGEAFDVYTACLCTVPSLLAFGMMLEEAGIAYRPGARPDADTFNCGALLSKVDISMMREVKNVIRLGYVHKVSAGHMLLDGGRYETADDAMYIDCTGSRIRCRSNAEPVWQGHRIKLQRLQAALLGDVSYSVGMIGMLEARLPPAESDTARNSLCAPWPFIESLAELLLSSVGQPSAEVWRRKDLRRLWFDWMGMRVNPMAQDRAQLKSVRQWGDAEVSKKLASNVVRVVAREAPETVHNFQWCQGEAPAELTKGLSEAPRLANTHAAIRDAKVGASAPEDGDSIGAGTREASPRRASDGTDDFFDFDELDLAYAAA